MNKPMKLLLIEDDIVECNIYRKIEKKRNDIKFILITDSEVEGIECIKQNDIDGVILDLELNKGKGKGTGFDFLEKLKLLNMSSKPKIIVTTNICSDSVYQYVHKNGADFVFYKKKQNYTQENVINTLLLLRGYTNEETNFNIPDSKLNKDNIADKINKELDLIGIGTHLQGRKYLYDSIYYILENKNSNNKISVVQYLVNKYKKSNSTISRAMQNAILHAWRISAIEDLSIQYTAKINYETGIPTPTEFIYYYVDKIEKQL